jgi:hypothetical protein
MDRCKNGLVLILCQWKKLKSKNYTRISFFKWRQRWRHFVLYTYSKSDNNTDFQIDIMHRCCGKNNLFLCLSLLKTRCKNAVSLLPAIQKALAAQAVFAI